MRSSPEPLYTRGFHRLAAEAAQVPALARLLAEPIGALMAVVLFVGVFCAGSAVMS